MSNPLLAAHEKGGAEAQAYGAMTIVSTFGQPQAEYAAIRKSAGIMDWPQRGLVELRGKDRLSFLNNLLTNQLWDKQNKRGLSPHSGVYAFFLNAKGRIFTDLNVLELGERTLLEMEARLVEPTMQALERYRFSEQVTMASRVGALHEVLVTGPKALEAIKAVAEGPIGELQPLGSIEAKMLGREVLIWRDDLAGVAGYVLMIPTEAAEAIWDRFTMSLPALGEGTEDQRFRGLARPVGWAAFNATRIEAGRPLFGIDFDESVLPAETGQLGRAVSFTKGCYLGQEIVARMHARGQLARQLVGLRMESDALPIAGAKIYDEAQNEIGGLTSSTISPVLSNAAIGLGYVRKPFIAAGTKVRIPAEGAMRGGTVVEMPFVR